MKLHRLEHSNCTVVRGSSDVCKVSELYDSILMKKFCYKNKNGMSIEEINQMILKKLNQAQNSQYNSIEKIKSNTTYCLWLKPRVDIQETKKKVKIKKKQFLYGP